MGGGGGGNTTATQVNYSPEEAAQRAAVMNEANRIYGETGPTLAAAGYPGAKPVGFNPNSMYALNTLQNYATGALPQNINTAQNSLNFSLRDVLYPQSNPALRGYMEAAIRPITQSYMDPNGIMSQIRTQAGQEGQVGGSRQGVAEGIAAGRYANAIGDTAANVANAGYSQGLSAMGRAQALAPGYAQMGAMPAQYMGTVADVLQGQEQRVEDYNAAARMWDLNAPWTPLQNYANIVFGGASPGTSTTGTTAGPSTASRLLGAGALGLGTYAGMSAMGGAGASAAGTAIAGAAPYVAPLIAALALFNS